MLIYHVDRIHLVAITKLLKSRMTASIV